MAEAGQMERVERPDDDVTKTDDGGAIVRTGESQQAKEVKEDFYDNLVPMLERAELDKLATTLIEDINRDKQARGKRDQEYADAIKRTGLGKEAPGGADFDGASRAVHPVMMEATVDYAARAIKELMPPGGPVKTYIPAPRPTKARLEKADRKKAYMNWQFLTQMPEFRGQLEQLLTQNGLSGSQYMRLTPDQSKRNTRPVPQFVPSDKVHIPYSATSFYTAERQTYEDEITRLEFEARVKAEMYVFSGEAVSSQLPEPTKAQQATDKIEGKSSADYYNKDGLRVIYECNTWLDIEEERGVAPYMVHIDANTRKILMIVRNWEEDDEDLERMQWMVDFPFIPWRGAFSIGLGQMIGSLAGAATGALRALLDSAHVNNIPTLLRLKGANFSGQSKDAAATQVVEVDGGVAGNDDIRRLTMPLPFNEPSPVLFSLLGFCVDAAKGVVRTTFEDLTEDRKDLPVGTTLAMIEQGMVVASSIHLRLCDSLTNVIRILHRIDRMYLTEDEVLDDTGELMAYRTDFQGPLDVVPTADPQVFSDVQRIAQAQVVADRAALAPDLYNRRATEIMLLERAKVPDPEGLLVPEQKAEPMNAVNENAAMVLGRPVAAFPEQDHLAHMQVLMDFMLSPVLGMMPNVAPTFMARAVEHLKEHVALWYVSEYFELLKAAMDKTDEELSELMAEDAPEAKQELDRLLADLSPDIIGQASGTLGGIPQVVEIALQTVAKYSQPPQMPVDPAKMAEVERKRAKDAQDLQLAQAELAAEERSELRQLSAEARQAAIDIAAEEVQKAKDRLARLLEVQTVERAEDERTRARLESEDRRAAEANAVKERTNTQDNTVAMRIAAAELETDEKTALSTGTGQDQNPRAE